MRLVYLSDFTKRLPRRDETGSANKEKLVRRDGLVVWKFKDTPFRAGTAPANNVYVCLQHSSLNGQQCNLQIEALVMSCFLACWFVLRDPQIIRRWTLVHNVLNAGRWKTLPKQALGFRGMPSKNGRISHKPDVTEAAETRLLNSWFVGRGRSSHRTPLMAVFSFAWIYLAAKMWGSKYVLDPRGYFSHQLTHTSQESIRGHTHWQIDVLS